MCGAGRFAARICLFLLGVGALVWAVPSIADVLSGDRLYDDVRYYAGIGEHRTGSDADHATSEWLLSELEAVGFTTERRSFDLAVFSPKEASLQINDLSVRGFPYWFPRTTPQKGFRAILRPFASGVSLKGAIAFVDSEMAGIWHTVDVASWADQANAAGAKALVLAINHPSGEHYQPNAKPPYVQQALPLPVILLSAKEAKRVTRAVNQPVTLRLTGETLKTAQGVNIIGRLKRNDGDWIVVSTPTSGWFTAAGERGPGVALWLALARWLAENDDNTNYLFVAASGHELDYLGARTLLAQGVLPPPTAVKAWIHFGASIGVRDWQVVGSDLVPLERVQSNSSLFAYSPYLGGTRQAFEGVPGVEIHPMDLLPEARGGELALYRDAGYPMIGFVGSHRFFHTPRDLPDVTSAALLAPYGNAIQHLVAELVNDK